MHALIAGLVFASATALVYVALEVAFSQERRVTRALRAVSDWEAQQAAEAEPLLRPFGHRVLRPAVSGVSSRIRALLPAHSRERLQHRLDTVGRPAGITPEGVVAARMIGALVGIVVGVGVAVVTGAGFAPAPLLLGLAATVAGYVAPDAWIDRLRARRRGQMRRALPDMLDMLTISVEAGLGFDMALVKLIQNTKGPLAEEFGRMLSEVQAGASRRDALRHMAERSEVPELDSFITAMVQADVFGVSVAGILQAQSLELRKKRRQYVEEQAQKAPVKMVFPIIFCMLPATLLVVLGPAIIAIGRTFGVIK